MPYIKQGRRPVLDDHMKRLEQHINGPGELNYCISALVDRLVRRTGLNYANLNSAVGALECAKLELYRRIAAPYEDTKIQANGDVYTCNLPKE